jgi:hypothetical protein
VQSNEVVLFGEHRVTVPLERRCRRRPVVEREQVWVPVGGIERTVAVVAADQPSTVESDRGG